MLLLVAPSPMASPPATSICSLDETRPLGLLGDLEAQGPGGAGRREGEIRGGRRTRVGRNQLHSLFHARQQEAVGALPFPRTGGGAKTHESWVDNVLSRACWVEHLRHANEATSAGAACSVKSHISGHRRSLASRHHWNTAAPSSPLGADLSPEGSVTELDFLPWTSGLGWGCLELDSGNF